MAGFRYINGVWQISVPVGTVEIYWVDWGRRRMLQSSDQIASSVWLLPGGLTSGTEYTQGLKTGCSIPTPAVGSFIIENVVTTVSPVRTVRKKFTINVT